jgi:cysteine desulfurase
MKRIYLDNAATTPISEEVFQAMLPFLKEQYGNPSSTHAEGRVARAAVEKSRRNIARLIGASPAEIFFTSGGTEANNTALKGSVRDLGVKRIISSPIEHACVKNSIAALIRDEGIRLDYVKIDQFGRADLKHLEELLSEDCITLVTLMHSNNEIGTLNDIAAIAALCKQHSAYFHTDTVQTIGYFDINTLNMPIHFLSGSAHKLHGPKGIGFLYINKNVHIAALIDGGGQERALRSGTENVPGIIGFGKAIEVAEKEIENWKKQLLELKNHFIKGLLSQFQDRVSFNGDVHGAAHYKVLSVNFDTPVPSEMLLFKLDLAGISASGGSACSSGAMKASAVISALGVPSHLKTVRFSFSHYISLEDIDQALTKLKEIVK